MIYIFNYGCIKKGVIFALAGFIIGLNYILNWVIKKNRRSIIVLMLCFVILLSGILVLISGIVKLSSNVDTVFKISGVC